MNRSVFAMWLVSQRFPDPPACLPRPTLALPFVALALVLACLRPALAQGLSTLGGHALGVTCVPFPPDGKTLASSSFDGPVRLWDVTPRRQRAVLEHPGWV